MTISSDSRRLFTWCSERIEWRRCSVQRESDRYLDYIFLVMLDILLNQHALSKLPLFSSLTLVTNLVTTGETQQYFFSDSTNPFFSSPASISHMESRSRRIPEPYTRNEEWHASDYDGLHRCRRLVLCYAHRCHHYFGSPVTGHHHRH
jgi:hypothetical protein